MSSLILKRAPIGWNQDDFDVLEDGVIVGRIYLTPPGPQGRQWMWASNANVRLRCRVRQVLAAGVSGGRGAKLAVLASPGGG
jgi:hypothetical protein